MYAEEARRRLGLSHRERFALALGLLKEKEPAEGYRALAQDEEALADPWLDSGLEETLEEGVWS